ncbi:NAD-dependent epimerase/dehydratase family protein [Nonomuraea sp. MG754425]|uniref:SDR family oxidoreductase n=1 Tax=Nonomuraea sp. MG754425 TaxID=2570319 RepID=UPI001F368265|nr:NmrA family NAD(P)-binding protein [Nonomuraea sp. MG754425]MCF6473188.1 NAD-dependent epimerase/dehydratase family protein [Nonomuraea sp. MG754425]
MTILVTGATGTVGRHLVGHLLRQGQKVRALTRNPATAGLPEGVEVVAGDLTDARTLRPAFNDVTAAHLINFGGDYRPLRNGQQIADLLRETGVGKVTLLSGWQEGSLEPAVRASTLQWTYLNPVQFMANFLSDWGEPLRTTGVVREPYGDRKSPPIHESDIAAVAATVLTQDGHTGQAYHLTGPEILTPREMIRHLTEVTGRDLRFEELTPDQTRQQWSTRAKRPNLSLFRAFTQIPGVSDTDVVEIYLKMAGASREYSTTLTDNVEKIIGRPPRTFAQWAAEHARHFQPQDAA